MVSRPSRLPGDDRDARRSRWATYVLAVIVLIAWSTVALDCISTRGFTQAVRVPDDPGWQLRAAPGGCQPDPHGASFTGTIENHGPARRVTVEVSFTDAAGRLVAREQRGGRADARRTVNWLVHASVDPAAVGDCTATATA